MADIRLDKARQIKYWQRCHGSYLPSPYTSADSTRLMWACFIHSAFDVLDVAVPAGWGAPTKDGVKGNYNGTVRSWVLSLQHPDGGFCGSPNHAFTGQQAGKGQANLAATFFALILLAVVGGGDGSAAFAGVRRRKLLRWLRRLQRGDGSFGQNLWEGEAVGGRDTRHSYLASGIRWMIRGDVKPGDEAWEEDIDVQGMVAHIRRLQGYDGGLAELSEHESHAGYVYCAIAALSLLDRSDSDSDSVMAQGISERDSLLKFLASRQMAYLVEEEDEDDEEGGENFVQAGLESMTLDDTSRYVGFNGRWNKKADSCYAWWTIGTLGMLGDPFPVSATASRRHLIEVMQHQIGGFSKTAGAPPDLYHSYLGLAALATMGDEDLKAFEVSLCCSKETVGKIEKARDGLLASSVNNWADDGFWDASQQGPNGEGGPWDDGTRRRFETERREELTARRKSKSEFYDPCQEAAQRSYKCLFRNDGDKAMCTEYFQYGVPRLQKGL
ncbi:hypothetical protein GMORB2_0748, partial [Geosmithia morbida]